MASVQQRRLTASGHVDLEGGSEPEPETDDKTALLEMPTTTSEDDDVVKVVKPVRAKPLQIQFLNGLRGLAALVVVEQHASYLPDVNLGACAVDVFFVLSAFLLTMLFERKCRQLLARRAPLRQWTAMLVDYFAKRFFRVYPLFAVVAVVLAMLSDDDKRRYFKVGNPETFDLYNVLTFEPSSRYHVFWTLPLEIGYYFLIPVLVAVTIALGSRWWLLLPPTYYWIVGQGMEQHRADHQLLAPHLHTFVAGSAAAILFVKLDNWIRSRSFEFRPWQVAVVRGFEACLMFWLLSIAFRAMLLHWIEWPGIPGPEFPFISVHVTAVMVIELLLPSGIARFFEWNFLCYAGKISFSMYMLHSFVIYSDWVLRQARYDQTFVHFGLTILLASASFWLIEHPSQLLVGRISRWLTRISASPSPIAK